jgi:uncharacterized membrane protein YdjX (TVP38/TMEM64 family)
MKDGTGNEPSWRRWLPLGAVVAGLVLFFALGLQKSVSFAALAAHRGELQDWVARLGPVAPVLYILVYAALAACSVPGAVVFTIAGGLLFGALEGGLAALIAATLGGTALFLVARTSLGVALHRRAGPRLRQLEAGFQANAASYLLVLRLVPLFPFWLVNLAAALLGVPLGTFVLCSFFGMAPGAFIYASLGAGAGAVIAAGHAPDFQTVFTPMVLRALVALAALALLPVLLKWRWRRKST